MKEPQTVGNTKNNNKLLMQENTSKCIFSTDFCLVEGSGESLFSPVHVFCRLHLWGYLGYFYHQKCSVNIKF